MPDQALRYPLPIKKAHERKQPRSRWLCLALNSDYSDFLVYSVFLDYSVHSDDSVFLACKESKGTHILDPYLALPYLRLTPNDSNIIATIILL